MNEPSLAVKSFIVNNDGKLLMLKRDNKDLHTPGEWEIPGGRLTSGEDPFEGLKRETLEETGLNIEILNPMRIHHFTRDDGQKITMVTFLCKPLSNDIKLSEEHSEHSWVDVDEAKDKIHPSFLDEIKVFKELFKDKLFNF